MRLLSLLFGMLLFASCGSSKGTKAVKPKTHKVWARDNKYIIDIPIGARHIRLFERKRTKTVRMN